MDDLSCQGGEIASEAEAVLMAKLCRAVLLDVHSGDITVQLKHRLEEVLWECHAFVVYKRLQVLEHLKCK